MKKNVLIVGGGGRDHSLAWKISQSKKLGRLFVAPGNGGTAEIATNVNIKKDDIKGLARFAKENDVDITIVGPNIPLAAGIVDYFRSRGLKIFGPTRAVSKLEYSKVFAKNFMEAEKIPTARFKTFKAYKVALTYIQKHDFPLVIKADGLSLGKGVYICRSLKEAEATLKSIMLDKIYGKSGNEVVVEEFLDGPELSIHALCDGKNYILFPASQDHKTIFNHGQGPNTGGMGAYSPVPWVSNSQMELIKKRIIEPALSGLKKRKIPFTGCFYVGVKITSEGPMALEFNVRFGDPETETYMMLLENDLLEVIESCINARVSNISLSWKPGFAVSVVMAAKGYPGKFKTSNVIYNLDKASKIPETNIFHMGTKNKDKQFITTDGRVLAVSAVDKYLDKAIKKAYKAVNIIKFEGSYFRTDIAESGYALKDVKSKMLDKILKLVKINF
jgi:phosphoribosylamine--glycine ligase